MTRYFNTEGRCRPEEHYMVRLVERLELIREQYVDRGKYFVINRGRQYGKTTTLRALAEYLQDKYAVIYMDFQKISTVGFSDEPAFVKAFIDYLEDLFLDHRELEEAVSDKMYQRLLALAVQKERSMDEMFRCLSRLCSTAEKPVVLMIDEVDSATNNQVFVDFLAQLRGYYLDREGNSIFHAVILAGVYDIKNLKLKIRPELEHKYNSPWNIAADFEVEMSFSAGQIAEMLEEYEADRHTGRDLTAVASEIFRYTSGYPYLVSLICKIMDEKLPFTGKFVDSGGIWTKAGVAEAVKVILNMKSTLFDSMAKHISEYPDLKRMLYVILFQGEQVTYHQYNHTIELACMFGYAVAVDNRVQVANRIFETNLYNLFLSEEELSSAMSREAKQDKNQFVSDGRLDMVRVLARFVEHFQDIYGGNSDKFLESDGRKLFLLYLRPIINGTGHYYIESQTRDERRTDVIVDYAGEQFILEMKIWHGSEYNERGERQLMEYLDYYRQDKGYMLSFNFNQKKETGLKTLIFGGKMIVEAVV